MNLNSIWERDRILIYGFYISLSGYICSAECKLHFIWWFLRFTNKIQTPKDLSIWRGFNASHVIAHYAVILGMLAGSLFPYSNVFVPFFAYLCSLKVDSTNSVRFVGSGRGGGRGKTSFGKWLGMEDKYFGIYHTWFPCFNLCLFYISDACGIACKITWHWIQMIAMYNPIYGQLTSFGCGLILFHLRSSSQNDLEFLHWSIIFLFFFYLAHMHTLVPAFGII